MAKVSRRKALPAKFRVVSPPVAMKNLNLWYRVMFELVVANDFFKFSHFF